MKKIETLLDTFLQKYGNMHTIYSGFMILFGNFLYALVVCVFLEPSSVVTSGVTGMALALSYTTGFSLARAVFLFNMILLLVGLCFLGLKFTLTTLLSTLSFPLFISLIESVLRDYVLTEDILLNTIFAGIGTGFALALVIRQGSSTGGMDIPPLILKKYFRIPVAVSMYIFDFMIVLGQCMVYPKDKLLYGIINIIIYTIVLDKMIILGDSRTELKIISKHYDEIRKAILTETDRGVTLLHGQGGYSGETIEIVLSVISNRELPSVEKMIHEIDPEAFITINRISEVKGFGFTMKKRYLHSGE